MQTNTMVFIRFMGDFKTLSQIQIYTLFLLLEIQRDLTVVHRSRGSNMEAEETIKILFPKIFCNKQLFT